MPAAHDIYAEQLCELRRGYPLYYPEPDPEDGPMEIGDVGFVRNGAFYRLFNASRSPDDSIQRFGVPSGFELLDVGRIRIQEGALEPGPLQSKSVYTLEANIGTPTTGLPLDASFHFKCTSNRGAILVQETQMRQEVAFQSDHFEEYLSRHIQSWYDFAKQRRMSVGFGEIMLVTECSRTAAWSSAIYADSSKEFGVSFSVGGSFAPCAPRISASAGIARSGRIERRRSPQRPTADGTQLAKHHTVFFKATHLGMREAALQSILSLFIRFRSRKSSRTLGQPQTAQAVVEEFGSLSLAPSSNSSSKVTDMMVERPDFHPATPLLASLLENSDKDFAFVHDDEWCFPTPEISDLINDYVQFHFDDDDDLKNEGHHPAEEAEDTHPAMAASFAVDPNRHLPLISRLSSILREAVTYKRLLKSQGAQILLDSFQYLLDINEGDATFRRELLVALQRLSSSSGLYPTSYTLDLENIQVGKDPTASGGLAQIYKGSWNGIAVCVMKIRFYQDTSISHISENMPRVTMDGEWEYQRVFEAKPKGFTTTADSVRQALDVASGLEYLHNKDILHGDLTGFNILIDSTGRARLAGFSISSVYDLDIPEWASYPPAVSKAKEGTIRWQAPELIMPVSDSDEDAHNTKASDVYAYGCVCIEARTASSLIVEWDLMISKIFMCHKPFATTPNLMKVTHLISSGHPPAEHPDPLDPCWTESGLSESIWAFMERCWQRAPNERPSAADVVEFWTSSGYEEASAQNLAKGDEQLQFRRKEPLDMVTVETLDTILAEVDENTYLS
ncbi:hypothetical protein H0H93_003608 [Arthromyces matolae]|nr:hypothetical protein H0H93_003608 [Arthromyces matolae]